MWTLIDLNGVEWILNVDVNGFEWSVFNVDVRAICSIVLGLVTLVRISSDDSRS